MFHLFIIQLLILEHYAVAYKVVYYGHLLLVPGIVLQQSIIHHHFILINEICVWSPGMGCYF